jgi:hypothetical protein
MKAVPLVNPGALASMVITWLPSAIELSMGVRSKVLETWPDGIITDAGTLSLSGALDVRETVRFVARTPEMDTEPAFGNNPTFSQALAGTATVKSKFSLSCTTTFALAVIQPGA